MDFHCYFPFSNHTLRYVLNKHCEAAVEVAGLFTQHVNCSLVEWANGTIFATKVVA